jgi:P-type Mg2+ transporter
LSNRFRDRRVGAAVAGVKPYWATSLDEVWAQTRSSPDGLSGVEAERRLERDGPNALAVAHRSRAIRLLLAQFTSPIILILAGATVLSMALGDVVDGGIILAIIAASGLLGFWQERSAGIAVDALLDRVQLEATVRRDGHEVSTPVEDIVVGDVVLLSAGRLVPADCRIVEALNLLVDEAALTGESYPAEKAPGVLADEASLAERSNCLFMGTSAVSGRGSAVVIATGRSTEFGEVSTALGEPAATTGFEAGINAFGGLLVRVMLILVTAVFVVNVILARPLLDSFLFSLALAVGLTPQLLPAIVSVSLATGARRMANEDVIVKRLSAIEDFGAMTSLCTDKTGTISTGVVRLDGALDLDGNASDEVLRLARLNAGLQQGFANPLDQAVLTGTDPIDQQLRVDEVPYDFIRKRLSVLVDDPAGRLLVTKGALTNVLAVCTMASIGGRDVDIAIAADDLQSRFEALSSDGYRVLGLATKEAADLDHCSAADEAGLTLRGILVFHDPPKTGAAEAIGGLAEMGVSIRLVTGDNRLAARKIADEVGLDTASLLTGPEITQLDDDELAALAPTTGVFAEVEPIQKERIVRALRDAGQVVGFVGDGINDAPALHAADVGISVDSAVDVAKQAAAIVLLDKDLGVVLDGVTLGRQTFTNTLKYVRVTTSANFGNVLSVAIADVFLPFLPLLPRQILLLNFLSDIPGVTIAEDVVDPEQIARPRAWSLRSIRTFMVVYGLISTVFDLLTFATLRLGFGAGAELFRSGWFVESTLTELAVMLVLRTNRRFYRSRPGSALLWSSVAVAVATLFIPYSPLAVPLGLTSIPWHVLSALGLLIVLYVVANELAKRRFPPDPSVSASPRTQGRQADI